MKAQTLMHQRFLELRSRETSDAPQTTPIAADETELLAVMLEPLRPMETFAAGHDRKEREIGTWFAKLNAVAAWRLHRRLANPANGDALAAAFNRLIPQRRIRLLAFLGDPKRRAAMRHA